MAKFVIEACVKCGRGLAGDQFTRYGKCKFCRDNDWFPSQNHSGRVRGSLGEGLADPDAGGILTVYRYLHDR